ncbi:MAG: efflux RND transporter periplasmic adaptor subunit [Prolixibacteraceae bacterium]|nr:efflux RND transporter periplasmic adaptor subunit [Prolixibacteraceae bacterium]
MKKITIIIILASAIIIGVFLFIHFSGKSQNIQIDTETIGRADISNTVTATGSLDAIVSVDVSTQVSGKIDKIYVDYNSIVKKGQLLARLDTMVLASKLKSSKASLDQAQADYEYQKSKYERYQKLIVKKLIAQTDFDEIKYNYKSSIANMEIAKASYETNKTDLGYAYIYSPIDGIVEERDVEEGETVASNFSAPTLFKIANDLTQMKIETDVDEADIGQVKINQRVEFNVDAYPDRTFSGKVTEVRLDANTEATVITYTVVINAPNPDKTLLPGMTANVVFYVTEKNNIVVVPNKAIQFTPNINSLISYKQTHPEMKVTLPKPVEHLSGDKQKEVWVLTDSTIYPKTIEVGETNEINYELLSGLNEGDRVIISMSSFKGKIKSSEAGSSKSPFMPTRPGRNKKK